MCTMTVVGYRVELPCKSSYGPVTWYKKTEELLTECEEYFYHPYEDEYDYDYDYEHEYCNLEIWNITDDGTLVIDPVLPTHDDHYL